MPLTPGILHKLEAWECTRSIYMLTTFALSGDVGALSRCWACGYFVRLGICTVYLFHPASIETHSSGDCDSYMLTSGTVTRSDRRTT